MEKIVTLRSYVISRQMRDQLQGFQSAVDGVVISGSKNFAIFAKLLIDFVGPSSDPRAPKTRVRIE